MPVSFDLVVCITSTALFDCSESHNIWENEGLEAYKAHQREHVDIPLPPGVGFRLVKSLMKLNPCGEGKQLVDVVLMSRNDSESGERVRNSIKYYELGITRMSFTSGTDVTMYLPSYECDLFLTTEVKQAHTVLSPAGLNRFKGIAAGLVCNVTAKTTSIQSDSLSTMVETKDIFNTIPTVNPSQWPEDQVRIVFDGDGVLFSDEAERVYRSQGIEAFQQSEQENEHIALAEGPLHTFALKLQKLRNALGQDNIWRIRTFLVTARNGRANNRAFNTLKKWGLQIDETHFLGGRDKTPFLITIDPEIFFDDSSEHIDRAKSYVPAAHITYGINNNVKTTDDGLAETIEVPVSDENVETINIDLLYHKP